MHQETPKLNDGDNAISIDEPKGFASPPCQRHEIDPSYGGDLTESETSTESLNSSETS